MLGYVMEFFPAYMHILHSADRTLHIMLSSTVLSRQELIGSHQSPVGEDTGLPTVAGCVRVVNIRSHVILV
ncbi:hypothetical protein ALI144C_29960 [Actinosynnema sp. ALI-1.44]|nr:hypothetical protein ALI144C_29960 [Actinosynnema sp. ALI-1.44]